MSFYIKPFFFLGRNFYIKLKWSLNIPKVAKSGVYTEVAHLKSELLVLYDREEKMWHQRSWIQW